MKSFELYATCPEETKPILTAELKDLGAKTIREGYKIVAFQADEELFYKLHLRLRTASRIRMKIKEFAATSPEMLFSQARRIHWGDIFDINCGYLVDGMMADRGEEFMSGNQVSKQVRLAIEDSFRTHHGDIPKVNLKDPKVRIVAHVSKGRCEISVDTSGKSLHKRGYKDDSHPAPLKETLAASILKMAGYNGSQVLVDAMCGSGTLAIEGCHIALNKAPLIHRKKDEFGFEHLKIFNRDLWRDVQEKIRLERLTDPPQPIYASDIDKRYVEMAKDNALRARVEKHIKFDVTAFEDLKKPSEHGVIVFNLPYGERLDDRNDEGLKEFYEKIGTRLKHEWTGWRAGMLVSEDSPYKFIGLKPSRKIKLLNGMIPVRLLVFEMFSGARKERPGSKKPKEVSQA